MGFPTRTLRVFEFVAVTFIGRGPYHHEAVIEASLFLWESYGVTNSFAFLGSIPHTASDEVCVARGPFKRSRLPAPNMLSVFAPHFFLDSEPWYLSDDWKFIKRNALKEELQEWGKDVSMGPWSGGGERLFHEIFSSLKSSIERGDFLKAVALSCEESSCEGWPLFLKSTHSLMRHQSFGSSYGFFCEDSGIVGQSPEILFSVGSPGSLDTVALAGTKPLHEASLLLTDVKEIEEHRLVVEGIRDSLSVWGRVEISTVEVLKLSWLAHLMTKIKLISDLPVRHIFMDLVRDLHPTPALGVYPKNQSGQEWLKWQESRLPRGRFGAPFGMLFPDGRAHVVVAIRNLQFSSGKVELFSGCGVVTKSSETQEWEELLLKRGAVKELFGLDNSWSSL